MKVSEISDEERHDCLNFPGAYCFGIWEGYDIMTKANSRPPFLESNNFRVFRGSVPASWRKNPKRKKSTNSTRSPGTLKTTSYEPFKNKGAKVIIQDLTPSLFHSIEKLGSELKKNGIDINLRAEDQGLLDSIYAPSKYPLVTSLPDFEPDLDICNRCIEIAEQVEKTVKSLLPETLNREPCAISHQP